MNKNPLISIIMPIYNTERYLSESVESVLNQTYSPIELICVNDSSTDNSLNILKSYKEIIIVNNDKNLGAGVSRNKGIEAARGEFIAFIDADDIWLKEKLAAQMKQFQLNPDLDISFTYMKCFISPELSEETKKLRYCPPSPMPGNCAGTMLIKKDSLKKAGGFEARWKVAEFLSWFNNAREHGLIVKILNEVFMHRRIHDANTGITQRSSRMEYLKIARELL
jgi:glycosyltransferase involved in cell wall biosynthesis